ncbi:E3 ubiquitin-protein ligase MBR2 [Zea mays]|nr:E3 ubiquitin-protein ligase MBR2 [Zea mays]
MLEANLVFGAFASYDRHRDMRMDIDDMSYEVHALSVCDDPEYFYDYVQGLIDGLNSGLDSRDIVRSQQINR